MKRSLLVAVFAFAAAAELKADPAYISDKLVVNVYAEADQESEKIATLDSGDAVDTLEKLDTFTRVKLGDGREGWVKSGYLSAQAPAIVRLRELEKERSATPAPTTVSSEELKQLQERNAALQSEVSALKQATAQAAVAAKPAEPQPDVAIESPLMHSLAWSAPIAIVTGVVGFLLGYRTLARRIEKKYGRLKLY